MSGRFDGNIQYWAARDDDKQLALIAVVKLYVVGEMAILRIIPAIDTFVKFSSDRADLVANPADSFYALLKANQEYFISSGQNKFMSLSDTTGNVVRIEQKGSVARNAPSI